MSFRTRSDFPLLWCILVLLAVASSAQGPAVVDSDLIHGGNGVRYLGSGAFERAGSAVSLAGDLNGDGYDDLVVGAEQASSGGAVYVVFGEPFFVDALQLLPSAAMPPNGFVVFGPAGESVGLHAASGGDFNGDGFDDLLVAGGRAGSQNDRAYLVYGGPAPDDLFLSSLTGERGLIFQTPGSTAVDNLRGAFVGDLNADGFDDVVLGAPRAGNVAGAAHVLFGRPAGAAGLPDLVEDTDLDGANGFTILSEGQWTFGHGVAGGGDANGDGMPDFVVGAPAAVNGSQEASGAALLVFGSSSFGVPSSPPVLAVSQLVNGEDGVLFEGGSASDAAGTAVTLSDLDGDGLADVAIGAPGVNAGGENAGAVQVVYGDSVWGSPVAPAVVSLASIDGINGFTVVGEPLDRIGEALAFATDFNGDGVEDLVAGADKLDAALVVLGNTSLGSVGSPATLTLADLSGVTGYVVYGNPGESFGVTVAAGDTNGDGLDDILIGNPGAEDAGEAVLVLGDLDDDLDGVPANFDNCLEHQNPAQRDTNGDTFGNRCDADLDNNGIVNFADLELMKVAFFTQGPDLDEDFNGDGMVNFADLGIMRQLFFGSPGPSGLFP